MRSHEIDYSNQILEASATVLVRMFYSYEEDIKNLNRLLSKTTVSWVKVWNETARISTKTLLFELISLLLLQLIMQDFLRQRLMIVSAKLVAESSLLLLFVAYWNLHHANFDWRWSRRSFVASSSWSALAESASFYRNSTKLLTKFLLILLNLNFLSSYWFWLILRSFDFAFVRFLDRLRSFLLKSSCDFLSRIFCFVLLLKSSFDLLLRMFLIFWFLMLCIESEAIEFFLYDLNMKNLFCIKASTSCEVFFNCFDVLDLSLLLWVIEIWNDWRLSLKTSTRSKALV